MKRLLFLSFVAVSFFACSKDDKNETPPVDYTNPTVLSSALKVQYGVTIKGAMPVGTGAAGAPVLDVANNNRVTVAVSGRYAVITPELSSGKFKGYYLKVAGADSYFKVDFSQPKDGGRKAAHATHSLLRQDGEDSLIVIKLPENANLDTFKIEYAVYDSSNVVSNVIKESIAVLPPAGGADGAAFVGSWQTYRYKDTGDTAWTMAVGVDTSWTPLKCLNGKLVYSQDGTPYATNIFNRLSDEGAFNANGILTWESKEAYTYLDEIESGCANLKYVVTNYNDVFRGGWSYNATRKELTLVFDEDGQVNGDNFEVIVHHILEITTTKILISSPEGDLTELVKK